MKSLKTFKPLAIPAEKAKNTLGGNVKKLPCPPWCIPPKDSY